MIQKILSKQNVTNDKQSSLTVTTNEQSASGRENNPYLLQYSEEANAVADITAEVNKIN